MAWFFFALTTAFSIVLVVYNLLVRGRYFHFSFLAAAIFVVFVTPQMPGIINSRFIGEDAVVKTLFFSILCLAMCVIGWGWGMRGQSIRDLRFSESRLLAGAAVLSLSGAYFFYQFDHLPDEERLRGILTGAAVSYLFFAKLLAYGFAIAVLCYARRPSYLALSIILFDTMFYLERIVIAGRRGDAAEFCLIIGLAYWFQRRWAVPRYAVVASLMFAVIAMIGAGQYRDATFNNGTTNWSAVLDIDLKENWNQLIAQGGAEMTNAVTAINNIDEHKGFDYGIEHWNSIVFAFVPAQLVGTPFKKSLAIPVPSVFQLGYETSVGSTSTGMTDAFASFWYFGCVKFLIIAWIMGWIYAAAMRGNTAMQLVYMMSVVPSMLTITHFTNEIVIAWIHLAAFMFPALYFARVPSPPDPANSRVPYDDETQDILDRPGIDRDHGLAGG
ncbi:hypothetical protein DTW90_06160 [Neorhizobium sp. P12A]|uniref:hypothetical protein n=1 Tax=Rhizobium/Agrobacterium group TaxID=227290 RepID=UPI001049F8B8|nr:MULTISPECIES: hypothetical protein [Rhizobium/Agrobacterium group]KAA0699034.1 hypothetical protein DTW90_06160 [Neorhizobium sp. P12A]TCR75649.1 hypothetical protein EV561_1218 [Rhizobium sp. BK376]